MMVELTCTHEVFRRLEFRYENIIGKILNFKNHIQIFIDLQFEPPFQNI